MRGHLLPPGGWETRGLSRMGQRKWQSTHLLLLSSVFISLVEASAQRV